jgi:hypothetical protein
VRNLVIFASVVVVAALSGVTAAQSNVAGKWDGTATPSTVGAPTSWTMTLDQDGAEVTGSYTDTFGGVGKIAGTVAGGQAEFLLTLADGTAFTAEFVVEGDEWTTCTYAGATVGSGTCSATRAE